MPVVFLGIVEYKGIGKTSGKPYNMIELHYADFSSTIKRTDLSFHQGLVGKTMPLSSEAIPKFKDLEHLTAINLDLEPDPDRDYKTTRVCGYTLPPKPVAAKQA